MSKLRWALVAGAVTLGIIVVGSLPGVLSDYPFETAADSIGD